MQTVDIYIGTSLRGPAKGKGRVMYLMSAKKANGALHEPPPRIAEYEEVTESSLTLYALRDALERFNFACEITVHTECGHVADALNQHWPEQWAGNGWKNQKKQEVKNACLWSDILQLLEEGGHLVRAEGRHEYSELMRYRLPLLTAYQDFFAEVKEW